MYVRMVFILVQFVDQYLSLSTILPGTESLYGLGEHKVSLKLKTLVYPKLIHTITHQLTSYVCIYSIIMLCRKHSIQNTVHTFL